MYGSDKVHLHTTAEQKGEFRIIQVETKVFWHSMFYTMPIESRDFCATLCIAHSSESHYNN
jgi:hypothetical protein